MNCLWIGIPALIEEVENINDLGQIKEITKKLIKDNLILARKTSSAIKSLDNQNKLINYLEQTLATTMAEIPFLYVNHSMSNNKPSNPAIQDFNETVRNHSLQWYSVNKSLQLWNILGTEVLRTLDNLIHYQVLFLNMAKDNCLSEQDNQHLKSLMAATYTASNQDVKLSRAKILQFLSHLNEDQAQGIIDEEEEIETGGAEERESTRSMQYQNGRIDTLGQNRKQQYRQKAKKRAIKHYRKPTFSKSQNNKSENSSRKNSRYSKLADAGETVQKDANDFQSQNFSGNRRPKRKTEDINNESRSDKENSSVIKSPPSKRTKSTKKLKNTLNDSISNSNNEPIKIKPFDLMLVDFMKDPDANNDKYIAQYKQKLENKESQNNCVNKGDESDINNVDEFDVLDDADDDADSDQRAESEYNFDANEKIDNEEEKNSTRSQESENNLLKPDPIISKSMEDDDEKNAEFPRTALLNGKKGPCTPPHSPTPDDYIFRRGPRTPTLSPPVPRRGPRTPPGAPTSDSEASDDEGDSSDSSSLSTSY